MTEKQFDLTLPLELRGTWWLPNNNKDKVSGVLRFDPKGDFTLELDGLLKQSKPFSSENPKYVHVVHGITKYGKYCSLLNTYENSINNSSGVSSSTFSVQMAVIGAFTPSLEYLLCRSVSFRYTNLEAWVQRRCFSYNRDNNGRNKKNRSVLAEYKIPGLSKYSIPEINSTLTLGSTFTANHEPSALTLKHVDNFKLRPKKRMPLEWFMSQAHHLRNLLALLSSERFFFRDFKIELDRQRLPQLGDKTIRVEGNLIFQQGFYREVKHLSSHEIPFTFSVVQKDLKNILEIWFKDREILGPAYDLFFTGIYNLELTIEFQFLSLIQALETLHRRLHKGTYVSKSRYEGYRQAMVAAIPQDVPNDLRDALKSRVKYGNEYSLRKRLTQMGRLLNVSTRLLITDDFKKFTSKVVDTRNYFTHYDPVLKKQAMSTEEIIKETFSLRLLLTVYLFKRIGMQESVVAQVIKTHRIFQKPEILLF